jgi:hypothetical protein
MNRKNAILLVVFLLMTAAGVSRAEFEDEGDEEAPLLLPKRSSESPLKDEDEDEPLLRPRNSTEPLPPKAKILKPKALQEEREPLSPWQITSLGIHLHTPLVYEGGFERRFSTFGGAGLASFPFWKIGEGTFGAIQTGLSFNVSRLTLSSLTFVDLIIDIPVIFQFIFALDPQNRFAAEVFLGGHFRALEYDSRPTTDGGFGAVRSTPKLVPQVGLGMYYRVSPALVLRLRASYLLLSLGIEFPL